MATIFAATSLELEPAKKKELIDALGETIGTMFKTYSLYYTPVPPPMCPRAQRTR